MKYDPEKFAGGLLGVVLILIIAASIGWMIISVASYITARIMG